MRERAVGVGNVFSSTLKKTCVLNGGAIYGGGPLDAGTGRPGVSGGVSVFEPGGVFEVAESPVLRCSEEGEGWDEDAGCKNSEGGVSDPGFFRCPPE